MDIDRNTADLTRLILDAAYLDESIIDSTDLSAATVLSLVSLTAMAGNPIEFCNQKSPPPEVLSWLHKADLLSVRGLLIEAIYRWHELR